MQDNFISVSAVSDTHQLKNISEIYKDEKLSFPLVIGYQVSNKSINYGTQNSRQPKFNELGILDRETKNYGFITGIHYYTKDNNTIIGDLEKIAELGIKPDTTLIQFNTLPPSIEDLDKIKKIGFKLILKVSVSNKQSSQGGYSVWKGNNTEDVSTGQVEPLINQVYDRKDIVDYIMFDPSHGTNLDLDLSNDSLAIRFGKEIVSNKELSHLGLVYAGGIKPKNVRSVIKTLEKFFPDKVSIDVESGVRSNDKLDLNLVKDYLIGCKK